MSKILYTAPKGERTIDPSPDFLRAVIYDQPWIEWFKSPNATASLEIILDDDEQGPHSVESHIVKKDIYFRVSKAHPVLCIKQPDPDDFFFTWFGTADDNSNNVPQYVPYYGDPCDDYTMDHSGGIDFPIPTACLVPPDSAFHIVCEYLRTQQRSDVVNWVSWFDLDLPDQ